MFGEVRIGKRHDETDGYLELTSGISFGDGCDVSSAPDCLGRADDSRKSPESSWGVADVIPRSSPGCLSGAPLSETFGLLQWPCNTAASLCAGAQRCAVVVCDAEA